MTSLKTDPMEVLRRKAIIFILVILALGGMITTSLHLLETNPHPISLVIPPLTTIVCFALLLYLIKFPAHLRPVIEITIIWACFIFLFPEYYFLIEALLNPEKKLVETLPPISSGILLISTSIIVLLNPKELGRILLLIWAMMAFPILIYLIFHPEELVTTRGLDLFVALVPAMAVNFALVLFYSRLQDTANKLCIERFHFKEISEKDALTGAFNRGAGEKILQDLIAESAGGENQGIGIILCDIDRFKQVNDNFGHLIGDRVLQVVTHCCQSHLRKKDTFIRWGGEEFLVLVTGDNQNEIRELAERLRKVIANQQIVEVGKVTASFGVALLEPQENLISLFARADEALYQAKKQGRNQVVLA
jgi:diguanylate cyclase (GGDEF)-like protein